ncbi:uncharacterized protein GIQ15_00742 [Arthroderma uncinatum]|uniref:uncharacterized protein n=1 Tax=Arthroderma uncinatum TaxID=74035 RepID=UPI00144AD3E4|nr:uncharacterized protein GIQ15_00742 [Arthroderma uncinatum]KAF3491225.1 hypothetical protein GIQ15_00742 [Arthroderma uncinatum]
MGRHAPAEPRLVHCKWWKRGHCLRGDSCYFRHDPALLGVDQKPAAGTAIEIESTIPQNSQTPGQPGAAPQGNGPASTKEQEQCAICLESPKVYGLLIRCDHVFCLECIRKWRGSKKADKDDHDDDEWEAGDIWGSVAIKSCPLCRKPSKYIIPSAVFPTPPTPEDTSASSFESGPSHDRSKGKNHAPPNPLKESIIKEYTRNMKTIPCRYFEAAVKSWKAKVKRETERGKKEPPFRPVCFFVNKCHYAHIHPITKKPYIFEVGHIAELHRTRRMRRRRDGEWERAEENEFVINAIGAHYARLGRSHTDVDGYPVEPPALEGADDEDDWEDWDLSPGILPHMIPLNVLWAYQESESDGIPPAML